MEWIFAGEDTRYDGKPDVPIGSRQGRLILATETLVLCFPVTDVDVRRIEKSVGGQTRVLVSNQDQISRHLMEADVFCGHAKTPVDWEAVVQQGRLRWIQSSAAGLDHCLVPSVVASTIPVSGCSGLFANQVAEQVMALLFGLVRGLPRFMEAQVRREFTRLPTDEITGETVGIVGFGGNGQRIAECLRPVAGHILATDLFSDSMQYPGVELRGADEIVSVFEQSKVVISTLPLTPKTCGLIGRDCFDVMDDEGYFINVGRGAVVDHDALLASLKHHGLAGVGLDVVEPEPLPEDHPLWLQENVLITPHVGAQSSMRVGATIGLLIENMQRIRNGGAPINLVDKSLGFPRPENRLTSEQRQQLLDRAGTV